MEQNTKTLDSYLNPLKVAEWLEKALAAKNLSKDADNLLQQLVLTNSIYQEAFSYHPAGTQLVSPIYLNVETTLDVLQELHAIMAEDSNLTGPDFVTGYYWIMFGHFVDQVCITLHTPKENPFNI